MKAYKLRPLVTKEDLVRARQIIQTGFFWASRYHNLNDAMEGVFLTRQHDAIKEKFDEKLEYAICSFSGSGGFSNPSLWGYYAGGFRGFALEVNLPDDELEEVDYVEEIPELDSSKESVKRLLSCKLKPWKPEYEYRWLRVSPDGYVKIGEISAIHFGDPYGNTDNHDDVKSENKHIRSYYKLRSELQQIANSAKLICRQVEVQGIKVVSK